jgi:hypothetical protein
MKELEVQKYLRSGKSLINLKQEYKIDFTVNTEQNSVVLNYSPLTPMTTAIGKESRALILDLDNWKVIAKSMDAFDVPTSLKTPRIIEDFDWNSAFAYPKYDGCLMVMYFHQHQWFVGTRFSTDSNCNVYSPNSGETDLKWIDLFKQTLENYGYTFEEFTANFSKDKYYSFELCSRFNRNIVIYEQSIIKIISIVDAITLNEIDIDNFHLNEFMPEKIKVNNLNDVRDLITQNDNPIEVEGFVVVDSNFNRLKVKNDKYTNLGFKNYSTDDVEALKEYASIILSTPSITEWYCVTCNPDPGNGSPTANCTEVPIGDEFLIRFPPEFNCVVTGPYSTSVECTNSCLDIDDDEGGQLSIQSSKMCTTQWSPKSKSIKEPISLVNQFVEMLNWFSNNFNSYKITNNESIKNLLCLIWEYAFFQMESGKSISEIINSSSEVDQILALEKFEQLVK